MNREAIISVAKGAGIAAIGAALTYLSAWVSGTDFGTYTPAVVAIWSVIVNAGRKLLTAEVPMAIAMLILLASGSASAGDVPPRLAEAGPPAVRAEQRPALAETSVYIRVDLGNGGSAGGTGTVIASEAGKALVITNAHVVESGARPITVTYWWNREAWSSPATYLGGSSVTHLGPGLIQVNGPDLALLAIDAEIPAVEVAAAIPVAGETVSLYGFGGTSSTTKPTLKPGRVLAEDGWRTAAGDPITRTSIASVNGDSGAGIFDSRGQLVAVHWGGGAVRLDTVHAFTVRTLERKGLFSRFKARLAARKISRAIAEAFPTAKPVPPTVRSQPAAEPAGHWENRCGTDSRGRKVCFRVWVPN